ncbi:MAG: DUF1588 domain-containing protein [Pseudomonadales bacterium]|nr:DUF1588 domain-containing protein [Pseudomonadales bacterium]
MVKYLSKTFSVLFLVLLCLNTANASRSTISNGYLYVPRIDLDGFGAMELTFRIEYTNEYLLVLETATETSLSISNSGSFNDSDMSLEIDEVELESGDLYAVQLDLVSQDGQIVFNITDAEHLNPPDPGSNQEPASTSNVEASPLYDDMCSNCHAANGTGTGSGPSLISCANCSSSSALANYIRDTMPLGQATSCDIGCANSVADYVLAAFNASNQQISSQSIGFIQLLDDSAALRRAAQQLVGRLPRADEFQAISVAGSGGLRQVINGMMTEDAFYDRLSEIWNDYLLTDKYHSRNGSEAALQLLSSDDYPNKRWFDPGKDNRDDEYSDVRRATNDSVAREPLELINYVVENDLAFTQILTANYMMMSPYSAQTFGVSEPIFENPNDPNEFRPVTTRSIPHAGILTSHMFLNRYPTTSTNRNRGRARIVFDLFLDTDILAIEGVRPGNSVDITTPIPTINNPECSKCHSVLDPVASIFQNWDHKGRYRPARLSKYGWYTDMEPRGFNGAPMPLSGNVDSSLQWLGRQIAADPRFPRAVTRIMVNGLTGKEPLKSPDDANASQSEIDAFIAERTLLNDVQTSFVNDGYNLKTLVREVMMSPYWRAKGLTSNANEDAHALTGASYLLSPEQLDRKIYSLFGFDWRRSMDSYYKDQNSYWASKLRINFHQIYGGIDSDSITTRLTSPNGLMGAMQLRMANELSCYAVPHDFWLPESQRRLFRYVNHETSPYNEAGNIDSTSMSQIRQNIQFLHEYLLGERVAIGSPEYQVSEDLFMNTLNRGRQIILNGGGEWYLTRLPSDCDRTKDLDGNELSEDDRLREDRQYVIRSWMAVVAYLLADYKFFYS